MTLRDAMLPTTHSLDTQSPEMRPRVAPATAPSPVGLRSPQRQTLVPQVIEALLAQIDAGVWPVGTRIPAEPELVAALGVGRNTLREAILALVHAGVLERRQGSGTYVRATDELAGTVARRIAGSGAQRTGTPPGERGQLAEAVEVRRAFEVEAARLAARRRTGADLAVLDEALTQREAAWSGGEVGAFVEADAALHEAIVSAAHNRMLADLYGSFGAALRASLVEQMGGALTPAKYVDHSELVEAIRAEDADGAAAAAGAYLEDT